VAALGLAQPRHERGQAELVHPGAVDAADERPGEAIDDRVAEAPAEERPNGFVGAVAAGSRGEDGLKGGAELLARREQGARRERREPGRDAEAGTLRDRDEPLIVPHVDRVRLEGSDDLVAETDLATERERRRARHQERVRSALDEEAVDPLSRDLPAESRRGLDQRDRGAGPGEGPSRREAGDTAAGHERPQAIDSHAVVAAGGT